MNTWKVILAAIVIFGAGAVTGGLVVQHSARLRAPAPQISAGPARPTAPISAGIVRMEFLRRVQRELKLTPQQQEEVHKILEEGQERTRKLTEPIAPQLREELRKTRENMRAVLTPEQQVRFDQLLKQQQQHPLHDQRHSGPPKQHPPEKDIPSSNASPSQL